MMEVHDKAQVSYFQHKEEKRILGVSVINPNETKCSDSTAALIMQLLTVFFFFLRSKLFQTILCDRNYPCTNPDI